MEVEENIAIDILHQRHSHSFSQHPVVQTKKTDEMLKFGKERTVDKPDRMSNTPLELYLHSKPLSFFHRNPLQKAPFNSTLSHGRNSCELLVIYVTYDAGCDIKATCAALRKTLPVPRLRWRQPRRFPTTIFSWEHFLKIHRAPSMARCYPSSPKAKGFSSL